MKPSSSLTIYDIGANVGSNIPYYLMKADKVIAVEANPALASHIRSRFQNEIENGRLVVENCAVVEYKSSLDHISFYIHKQYHVWSTAIKPVGRMNDFETITIPCKTISDIVFAHGPAHYIKIDIEGFDHVILNSLFRAKIYPSYISVEAHTIDVFCSLVESGKYTAFKLVEGRTVQDVYQKKLIKSVGDQSHYWYSFPADSAGPFGDDIVDDWMSADQFFRKLAFSGLGWKDIHATNLVVASSCVKASAAPFLGNLVSPGEATAYLLMYPFKTLKTLFLLVRKLISKLVGKLYGKILSWPI